MNSRSLRYPIDFKSITVKTNDNKPSSDYCGWQTKYIDFIEKHYDEIIELCRNNDYTKLEVLLLDKLTTTFEQIVDQLFSFCVKNNNLEHFRTVTQLYSSRNMYINNEFIEVIKNCNNPVPFYHILLIENNLKITDHTVSWVIGNNHTEFISYLVANKYNITKGWNITLESLDNYYGKYQLNMSMLKVLMDAEIDISADSKIIIESAIFNCDQDNENSLNVVEFMVESFPNIININEYLDWCCKTHNIDALIYFLKRGANIHIIDNISLCSTSIDIINILINHNYHISEKPLKKLLIVHFTFDIDLTNINYLLANGAQIQWIIDDELNWQDRSSYNGIGDKTIYSHLEFIITKGEFYKIKFLTDNYLNLLKPEINRLFVLACANGQNDIASYLFDFGAELNEKALISAIFFGHCDTLVMLMKFGMNINSLNEDLFIVSWCGYIVKSNPTASSDTYGNLINNNTIFRNDIVNYESTYQITNIIKLLINCGIRMPNDFIPSAYSNLFYDVDIFTYFIQNGFDIDKNNISSYYPRNILEGVIIFAKPDKMNLDIIELLLQNGFNLTIKDTNAIEVVNDPVFEPIKILLLKYGIYITSGLQPFSL